ncbi:hypothetical protein BDN72DRAFT_185759 [Pluteus cervinus]|uniref:Uncharacterized protein n=1 Tax=Pluteus cervinus TaxID=181527 RepID=A0ACD3B6B1_9AGAR|nr:hypothetical protein BDN72DRAFT_185759 [Pluteus cervinus]
MRCVHYRRNKTYFWSIMRRLSGLGLFLEWTHLNVRQGAFHRLFCFVAQLLVIVRNQGAVVRNRVVRHGASCHLRCIVKLGLLILRHGPQLGLPCSQSGGIC